MIDPAELIVDSFAGGGGASTGIEQALGRPVDIAINHDAEAVALHAANHPQTRHFCNSVWQVRPEEATGGRPVGLLWASPDCKHFSKAKGAKPVEKNIRDLAWVVVLWARTVRPRVIMLENVEEFRDWGPLVTTEDGRLVPCPLRKGLTFRRFVRELRRLGYAVEHRELRACDYGAPTIRKRLFLIARRDGRPIVWPAPTHGAGRLPWLTAASCIDWSIPCPSIFGRKRPLVENTLARIARGIRRYLIDAAEPFVVPASSAGGPFIVPVTHHGDLRAHPASDPLRTITTARRGEMALVAPFLKPRHGETPGQAPRAAAIDGLMPPVVPTANGGDLVAAFLAQHNGGPNNDGFAGRSAAAPLSTTTARGTQQQVVAAHLLNLKGSDRSARPMTDPAWTITAKGEHVAEVRAFLMKYYGTGGQDQSIADPMHTLTAKARMGLVTVRGEPFQIVDIGMRMLTPRELYRAQGFPESYAIDRAGDGGALTKTAQIRMCGNSVCPPVARALVAANFDRAITAAPEEQAA